MKRRDFIKNVAIGASAATAVVSSAAIASGEAPRQQTDVYDAIVVGGGFAGVTAARDTSLAGLRTLLLDARPRLGGRTFTTRFADHDIDMGGTWLGWGQPSVWAEKMRYDLPIAESAASQASSFVWFENGKRKQGGADDFWPQVYEAYDKFYAPAFEHLDRPYDPLYKNSKKLQRLDNMSAADAINALDVTALQKQFLHSFAAINGHSDSKESSYLDQLRWLALSGFNKDFMWANISKYRLKNGTKELIEHMQADSQAEVKLGSAVVKVEHKDGIAEVTNNRGQTFRAHTVIMALPLNVISSIEFLPGLSAVKQKAAKQGMTGSGVKIYMRVKGRHPVMFGNGPQDMPLNYLWTEYDDDNQLLVGFGKNPELLDVNDDEAVQKILNEYIPGAELLESFSYDWNIDPYSKGTWCMYPPGMLTTALEELQRPEGNVYFAGGDIASGWRGFIDGAIESGARAAQLVENKFKSNKV
jgi:monoamine oxidase